MNDLLTAADLGKKLGGVPAGTVMEWQRTYKWPHVQFGRKFRWTEEQAEQIVKSHTVAGKPIRTTGQTARSARRAS